MRLSERKWNVLTVDEATLLVQISTERVFFFFLTNIQWYAGNVEMIFLPFIDVRASVTLGHNE